MPKSAYGYPLNVYMDFVDPELTEAEIAKLSADKDLQKKWSQAMDIAGVDERGQKMIELYYKNDLTLGKIGERFDVSGESVRQKIKRDLVNNISRNNEDVRTIVLVGLEEYEKERSLSAGYEKDPGHSFSNPVKTLPDETQIPDISVYELDISSRLRNVLIKANISSLKDLIHHDPIAISGSRNIGNKTFEEYIALMEKYGVQFNEGSFEELNKKTRYKDYRPKRPNR